MDPSTPLTYTYGKFRREFGKQCRFGKSGPQILVSIMPDPSLDEDWIPQNPVSVSTSIRTEWSVHEVNTERVEYVERGMCHKEGGWPKEVNQDDPDQMARYRKKAEKEESYIKSVLKMSKVAEHYIKQNNALDLYQEYFTDPKCQEMQTLTPSYRTVAIMSDPCKPTRPVQHISWSPEQGTLVAVSYSDMRFQMADPNNSNDSFIFDLEDSTRPYFTIESPRPIVTLEFNHRDAQGLAGGLTSGQVAYWDIRKGSAHAAISDIRKGHLDPVKSLCWINSKTSTEFFSGSRDGQVMWWDTRKLSEPTEVLILDTSKTENPDEPEWTKRARTHGVTCMDYDPLIASRFMIGTETGLVFNGNRKGKTALEKISAVYNCQYGPVYSAQRNPAFLKNFLTIGFWQASIWSEDVKESPIIWTKHHDVRLTDGAWSESKPSVFYTTRADGCLDCWDILQKQKGPIKTIKVADKMLNCIRCHEGGSLLAVGDDCGKTHVIKMNNWFVTPRKNDKALLTAMFDRETRREKIVEAKQRELKLKSSAKADTAEMIKDKQARFAEDQARNIREMEKEFKELVAEINLNDVVVNENIDEMENQEEEEILGEIQNQIENA